MARFVIYKNGRKYSNIKFTDIDECKKFIKYNLKRWSYMCLDNYDIFEYPSGKFVTRLGIKLVTRLVIEDTDKSCIFTENCPEKTPRNRRFNNK